MTGQVDREGIGRHAWRVGVGDMKIEIGDRDAVAVGESGFAGNPPGNRADPRQARQGKQVDIRKLDV